MNRIIVGEKEEKIISKLPNLLQHSGSVQWSSPCLRVTYMRVSIPLYGSVCYAFPISCDTRLPFGSLSQVRADEPHSHME
jgi:hypothetical protein